MKPSQIFNVLDLAKKIRKKGVVFNPLFTGDAGVGKSEICQAWAKAQGENFGFIDLRPAYLEGPDFVGLPFVLKDKHGTEKSIYALPEMWPTEGEGLLLIEEPNRANSSTLNCLMQVLTDRAVGKYKLPDGWMIASCINPDNAFYSVQSMDTALYNRFEEFIVRYDHKEFVVFMEKNAWHNNPLNFVRSNTWVYTPPEQIGNKGKYISPRSFSKVNNAEWADVAKDSQLHYEMSIGILGEAIGTQYHKFIFEITPVTAQDIVEDKVKAFEKLKKYSDKKTYRGDLIDVTVESIAKEFGKLTGLNEDVVIEAVKIIPMDQGNNLLLKLFMENHIAAPKELVTKYPDLKEHIKYALKREENKKDKEEVKDEVKAEKKAKKS
jgi:hypothetical protein